MFLAIFIFWQNETAKLEIGRTEAELLLVLGIALIALGFAFKRLLSFRAAKTNDEDQSNSFVHKQTDVKINS